MTMRSKQWYTKTSRLSNSFANNSIGRLPDRAFSNKIIGEAVGGVNRTPPGAARKERKGFQRERNRRFRSLWATSQTATNAREYPEARIFKFQICLASAYRFLRCYSWPHARAWRPRIVRNTCCAWRAN